MPCWYYDKKELRNTPSKLDGISYETEMRYRKEGARFIKETGSKMDLGYNTMATGMIYFHRFYMFHSFRQFPRYVTACCCLFLAGKVEETPKKCKDIIKTAKSLLSDQKFQTFGEDPKEEVMTLERILLQTIKFDLQVEHPYYYLLKYAKCLKGDKTKLQKMVQMAWTFVNDSLCTTLALQWEPEIIAVALMYLACKLSQFEVVDWIGRTSKHLRWWDMFVEDVTMDLLEDICHQVLDLYQSSSSTAPESPPLAPRAAQGSHTPIKGLVTSNGQEKMDVDSSTTVASQLTCAMKQQQQQPAMPPDAPPYPYNTLPPYPYPAPTHIAPPPGPPHMSGPPPPMVFPTYPPGFPPIPPPNAAASGFYANPPNPNPNLPPPHRPPYFK
ncbi:PREDICTED: cyclin-K [Nicrophorus vespilloides]|uniref:Cyclin-K n=1 Tax=Nicrophorus vespilloides TaxID=110193 RepID=A0ABM1NAB6_NICVS|nr:PREDICTED: cyclin-K [Nicrophorus vespilloides]